MFEIVRNPALSNAQLNSLFDAAWPNHKTRDFLPVLKHSLAYIAAFSDSQAVGFVSLAWDGGVHAFILHMTVHPQFRRVGLALTLLDEAAQAASAHGIECLHVDFEPHLEPLYRRAGYRPTQAGLLNIAAAP